ncbi:MAG: SagB/ThcOx family dehydrogenase [Candidatus Cloacimonetes bacterium]|nr:SagB/ThcOx family dehydrogenase [Candidatus Cloacimonadota bacterium]MCF7815306.1 SagB/ThcOx family dehydrogenase [Candidatus Cloacimonadota bacterium]MCF7868843.1 SagB/ThcOx family dehydrogenase [Candidatus Cloacimonadota bacterium]MCF7884217.1 SagB/ThcOx family dehydrogenase [Candidatus Cloacimonadota bacterium]
MDKIQKHREFMKANFKVFENFQTDQMKNIDPPDLQKPVQTSNEIIDLPKIENFQPQNNNLKANILHRRSHRKFSDKPLGLEEFSFLLWATQGVKEVISRNEKAYVTLRTVPSAGARHPFETYLIVHNVESLKPGLYRYLGIEHKLAFLGEIKDQKNKTKAAALGQKFVGECAVVFIWSVVPYRTEWRYYLTSHKTALLDAGHVCQNLYLACEGIGAGTCAIAAYNQKLTDELIGVDGIDEYAIYMSPVGHLK